MTTTSPSPTVGLFPSSFPRDPIEVNIYVEHVLLGYILEPLVRCGNDGVLVPAVASQWFVSADGLTVDFMITKDLRFSNGMAVTAADVKYSLERHLRSQNSQSKVYLRRIKQIKVTSPLILSIELTAPYIAILKALSRDQLGIVPEGWTFDRNVDEPYIGTGAYRAIRENDGWSLVANANYSDAANTKVQKWRIVLQDFSKPIPEVPDFAPVVFANQLQDLMRLNSQFGQDLITVPITNFMQGSAWWYPHGETYNDLDRRLLGMQCLQALIEDRAHAMNIPLATGLIPQGIPGSLSERIANTNERYENVRERHYVIYAIGRDFDILNSAPDVTRIEKQYSVQLKLHKTDATMFKQLVELKPDILYTGFGGAFIDPDGFVSIVASALLSTFELILGPLH